jgi:tripartite-type tricarboxylate transporter receptor subunit TctC
VQSGQAKGVATTGKHRSRSAPGLPTMEEGGLPLAMEAWLGLFAASRTPAPILNRLQSEIRAAGPDLKRRLEAIGSEALDLTPEQSKEFISAEYQLWTKVIRDAGIRLD